MGPGPRILALVALLAASGCHQMAAVDPVPRPPGRPDGVAARAVPVPADPGPESAELRDYYARIQQSFLTRGLLRRDRGGPDTPYDADRLAETFLELAFFEEYAPEAGILIARKTRSRLHRWDGPVRIEARFGRTVPPARRTRDTNDIAAFAGRLERAAQHPVAAVPSGGNFIVYIVNEAERRALGPELSRLVPDISPAALGSVLDLPRSSYCVVLAVDRADTGRYSRAVALIRAEHPDLLRLSCLHEEIAQGLGLANDSPRARPSIFNDDEEFALLTAMDEQLLRILYDPRLTPGMTLEDARPLVHRIARELMGAAT